MARSGRIKSYQMRCFGACGQCAYCESRIWRNSIFSCAFEAAPCTARPFFCPRIPSAGDRAEADLLSYRFAVMAGNSDYTLVIQKIECEDVMNRTQWLEDFQKNLSDLIARSPAADVERNVKAMMGQAFAKMDLITREEFDVQADLLARARERVDQLQTQVQQLEARVAAMEGKAE